MRLLTARWIAEEVSIAVGFVVSAGLIAEAISGNEPPAGMQLFFAVVLLLSTSVRHFTPLVMSWHDDRLDRTIAARRAAHEGLRAEADPKEEP